MDNQMNETAQMENKQLQVSDVGEYHMLGIAKWMKIIAVIVSIMVALMFLAAVWMISKGSFLLGPGIIYLIVVAIYLYPLIKTFGVSKHFNQAVAMTDNDEMERGLNDMRGLVTFLGILMIIGFVIVLISSILGISAYNEALSTLEDL